MVVLCGMSMEEEFVMFQLPGPQTSVCVCGVSRQVLFHPMRLAGSELIVYRHAGFSGLDSLEIWKPVSCCQKSSSA